MFHVLIPDDLIHFSLELFLLCGHEVASTEQKGCVGLYVGRKCRVIAASVVWTFSEKASRVLSLGVIDQSTNESSA